MRNFFTYTIIIVGALLVTTLGIRASDTLGGVSESLLGLTFRGAAVSECPDGMIPVPMVASISCVDRYEASPGRTCPVAVMRSSQDTSTNLAVLDCQPASVSGQMPWLYVHREEARALCARAGKRLPTASEWYQIALGTPADSCVTDAATAGHTGAAASCVSAVGVHDAVGNVWEWQSGDVINGKYNEQMLPEEGYVLGVTAAGLPTRTTPAATSTPYGMDFFWATASGTFGILRGGFYGSGEDAGVYATHAKTPSEMTTPAIGFRCVL